MTLAYSTNDQAWSLRQSLEEYAAHSPGVMQAVVVSEDGLLLAMSANFSRDDCDRFAAITSAMTSLAIGAARTYDLGSMNKLVVDLDRAYLLLGAFGSRAWLGVIARRDADLGDLARQIASFVERTAPRLTARLVADKNSRPAP